jgi:hypothetical protein
MEAQKQEVHCELLLALKFCLPAGEKTNAGRTRMAGRAED